MKYSYYPGCSLEKNSVSYHQSSLSVAKTLGQELVEIDDWNCCGATEYVSLNLIASYALIARNLAQASKNQGVDRVVAPCSACYLNLRKTDHYMAENPELAEKVNTALAAGGLIYQPGSLKIRHMLDVVVNDIGLEAVATKVTRPLHGLRVAPYYGCMLVRPEFNSNNHSFDNPEYPTSLDNLMKTLKAEVVDYPMKADCCGGHMTQISASAGYELIRRLVKGAVDVGADLIVTVCPMCQLNLDAFQSTVNNYFKTDYHMPVLYFTQLMGLAFGTEANQLGIGSELVDPRPALRKIGVEVPAAEDGTTPKKPRRDDKSLPMPKINAKEKVG